MTARDAIGQRELANQNDPVVRLQRDAFHRIARASGKTGVHGSVGVQTDHILDGRAVEVGEAAAHHHATVRLDGQRANRTGGSEAKAGIVIRVERPIHIQARQPAHGCSVEMRKVAADQHLASVKGIGRISGDGKDRAIRTRADGERSIGGTVIVQAPDAGTGRSADIAKGAAHINLTGTGYKGLSHGIHDVVGTGTRIEAGVQGTVGHHPRNKIAVVTVNGTEGTAHQNAAVGLADDGLHRAVRPGEAGKERGVQGAVRIQAGKAALACGTHGGEIAAGENLPAGLQREREHVAIHARGDKSGIRRTGRTVVRFGIQNLHNRGGRRTQRRIGRIGQRDIKVETGRCAVHDSIIHDRHGEAGTGLACRKNEGADGVGIVDAGNRVHAGAGGIIDGHLPDGGAGANDGDGGAATVFIDVVNRRAELQRAVAVIIGDGERGIADGTHERRGIGGTHHGIEQGNAKLPVGGADHASIDERHGDYFLRNIPAVPVQGIGCTDVIPAIPSRAVGGGILN